MTAREFCYWLQGFFELRHEPRPDGGQKDHSLTSLQAIQIQQHLAMVFRHEIDPSAGDAKHQQALSHLHGNHPPGMTPRC